MNEQILMKLAAYGDTALQKEAAYGDTVKGLGRKILGAAEDAAIDKFLRSKTKEEFRRAGLRADAIRAANRFVQENAKGITTGALVAGTGGALAGARALITRQREREKTASYYAVREMLGLGKEASQMNEQILMKLAEAEKKQNIKQILKDTAWTIGLSPIAPSVGFAIDQQRRNIKKEKATGEKPKSLIERRPGVVGGAVVGGLIDPLSRMAKSSLRGVRTSPTQLASEMVRGAAGGAIGGLLLVDPLTRWGTKRYYRKKDEKALRNELLAKRLAENEILRQAQVRQAEKYLQENPLQKTAAYGDTIKNLAGRVGSGARNVIPKAS